VFSRENGIIPIRIHFEKFYNMYPDFQIRKIMSFSIYTINTVRQHYQQCISVWAVALCSWTGSNYKIIVADIWATNLSLVLAAREIVPLLLYIFVCAIGFMRGLQWVVDEAVRVRNWPFTVNYSSYIRLWLVNFLGQEQSCKTRGTNSRKRNSAAWAALNNIFYHYTNIIMSLYKKIYNIILLDNALEILCVCNQFD